MRKLIALSIILAVSIGINVWFFSGKGIQIYNYTRNINHQEQYQQQWQGMLSINQFMTQGNTLEWKLVKCLLEDVPAELNKLHPISSLYCKITLHSNSAWVDLIYPDIFAKTKDVEVKK